MAKLKPIQRFPMDVEKGDLVRFVFKNGTEKTGHYVKFYTPMDDNQTHVITLSTRWPKGEPKPGLTPRRLNDGVIIDPLYSVWYSEQGGETGLDGAILGYEVLRRKR